ncbi:hypothetical protein [Paraburkholderia sp. BCC1885]|uniref:hypothetical protein n=1 Tax=Paraburkholderia sp. BCC1885 TaxID=2562669 RepID=UPI00118448E8|nr:hypothetical protein [Paraburkholderia sp. BCC1885]
MKNLTAAALLSLATISAHAAPNQQWKDDSTTFATLVQSGYRLVTVDHTPPADGPSPSPTTTVYYLQKDANVVTCRETHRVDTKTGSAASDFACSELVQPYDSTTSPKQ